MGKIKARSWRDSTWVVVFCCFMMIFTGLGFCSSPKSFFLKAVSAALNVERSAFALNDTARYIVTAVLSLFFGSMVSKLGTKKMIIIGFVFLILSQFVYAAATNVFLFCTGGALLGAGLSMMGNTMASYIIKRRCTKNAGTILGFVMAANGLGGSLATQIVSGLIAQGTYGYRKAYFVVAGILTVVTLMVAILFKEDKSVPHTAPEKKKARGQSWIGIDYKDGVKRPYFYVTCVLVFLTGFVLSGINGITTTHWEDVGIPKANASYMWSIQSLVLMGSKFFAGFIYDRKGLRTTLLVCQIASITMLIALSLTSNTSFGIAMAWYSAVASAVSLPLETIGVSLVTGDIFGNRDFSKFLGIMMAANSLGFALAAPLVNIVNDIWGTYIPAILASAGIMFMVLVVFQLTITVAHKDRDKIVSASVTEAQ